MSRQRMGRSNLKRQRRLAELHVLQVYYILVNTPALMNLQQVTAALCITNMIHFIRSRCHL